MAGSEGGRPILMGLAALVAVGLVVGALMSAAALAGASFLGLSGDSEGGEASGVRETMVVPEPKPTETTTSPAPSQPAQPSPSKSERPAQPITLSAGQDAVSPMGRIDLTGSYPEGEGAILQVQRWYQGSWGDFPVDTSVSGGQFHTWVQTGRTGENRFRMLDTNTGVMSNVVTVQVG